MQISVTPEFAVRLREELRTTGKSVHNPHGGRNTELEHALSEDMLRTSVGWANSYYANESYANGVASYTEEWGIGWKSAPYETRFGSGFYTEIALHPLADVSALETYTSPDPNSTELYEEAAQLIASYKQDYWIVGVNVTTIFETVWRCAALSGC